MTNRIYQDTTIFGELDIAGGGTVGPNLLAAIRDAILPVGTIVTGVATSPAATIGGTWEQIEGVFILAAGSAYPAGNTGGTEQHRHTFKFAIPSFFGVGSWDAADTAAGRVYGAYKDSTGEYAGLVSEKYMEAVRNNGLESGTTVATDVTLASSTGDTGVQENMPPYQAEYTWKRVA